jgi:type III secretion protein L
MLQLNEVSLQPEQKIVSAEEYQVYLDAESLIARARQQAEQIVAEAQSEYERRTVEGYEEGLARARMELAADMVDSVSKTVDYFSGLEDRVVELVIKAVRKVIGEIDDRECIVRVVRNALAVARNQSRVTVRVSSRQLESVQDRLNEIMRPYPAVQFIDVVTDPRLQPGGCILETEIGVVDASVDVQLRAIEKYLSKPVSGAE